MQIISLKAATTVIVAFALSSCTIGKKVDYQGVSSFTNPPMTGTQGVAVVDMRPYVLAGVKSPEWVGLMKSFIGIPFGMHTKSGQPLAADLTGSVAETLRKNGVSVVTVTVPSNATMPDISAAFRKAGATRGLLFEIEQWRTSTLVRTAFDFDVTLKVVSPDGQLLGSTSYEGRRVLNSSQPLSAAIAEIFSRLLSAPEVTGAQMASGEIVGQGSQEGVPKSPDRTCSTEHILNMRDLGISAEQIKAVCRDR